MLSRTQRGEEKEEGTAINSFFGELLPLTLEDNKRRIRNNKLDLVILLLTVDKDT